MLGEAKKPPEALMHCLNKSKWAALVTQLQGPFLQHLQQVVLPCGTVFQKAKKGKSKINVVNKINPRQLLGI